MNLVRRLSNDGRHTPLFKGTHPIDTLNQLLGILAALIFPGLGMALLLRPQPSWPLYMARTFLWGPVLVGVLMTLLDISGHRGLLMIVFPIMGAVLLVIAFIIGARREDAESPEEGPWEGGEPELHTGPHDDEPDPKVVMMNRALATAFGIGLALTLIVILPPLCREWIRERGDSWFHASIFQEILLHGVPPQDPYFAGLKLQYMWFFHEILTGLHLLTKVAPFHIMIAINGAVLIALCVTAADLARSLWDDTRAAVGAALVTPLGLGVLFWLFFPLRPLRALLGRSTGPDQLAEAFRLVPFDIVTTRDFLADFGSSPFFLNKFMVGTAYGLALVFLLAYLASVIRYLNGGGRGYLAGAGLELLALLLLHPVVGLTALALSGVTGLALLVPGLGHRDLGFRRIAEWGFAAALAAGAAAPYLAMVMRNKPAGQLLPFHFDPWLLLGILIGCFFVIAASIRPLRDLARRGEPGGRFFLLWIPAMVLFAAFIRLPGPNSSDKFTYLLYLPLSIAAGAWAGQAFRGRRGVILALLILLPANAIGYAAYWFDPAAPGNSADVVEAYDWIRAGTTVNDVIVEKEGRRDLLVRGPRRLYFASQSYAEQWGYDPVEMERRRGVLRGIYGGTTDDPGDQGSERTAGMDASVIAESLRSLNVDAYIILRAEDFAHLPSGQDRLVAEPSFKPVFSNGTVRIYQVR